MAIPTDIHSSASAAATANTTLPPPLLLAVFNQLELPDLCRCRGVCREWRKLAFEVADPEEVVRRSTTASIFGAREWKRYFHLDVPDEPKIDLAHFVPLYARFLSLSVENGRGFSLLTMPANLTLNQLKRMRQAPPGPILAKDFSIQWASFREEKGDEPVAATYRTFITNNILLKTRNQSVTQQQALLAAQGCRLPRCLELTTLCVVSLQFLDGESYGMNPLTYSRCEEIVRGYHPMVGRYHPTGFKVETEGSRDSDSKGAAAASEV